MWFKTRVGLFSILEPWEVKVAYYRNSEPAHVAVYVKPNKEQDFKYKGIFGKFNASNSTNFVARFCISDTSERSVAHCIERIADAIQSDVKVCDMSAIGDAAAWPNWNLIAWDLST